MWSQVRWSIEMAHWRVGKSNGISNAATFAATDIICALLPLAFISKIHRPFREKVVLAILMGLGLLATACGFVKLVLFKETLRSRDSLWNGAVTGIWT